jgi:hypothetical protein
MHAQNADGSLRRRLAGLSRRAPPSCTTTLPAGDRPWEASASGLSATGGGGAAAPRARERRLGGVPRREGVGGGVHRRHGRRRRRQPLEVEAPPQRVVPDAPRRTVPPERHRRPLQPRHLANADRSLFLLGGEGEIEDGRRLNVRREVCFQVCGTSYYTTPSGHQVMQC